MKPKDLAELLDSKPTLVTEKIRSTNKLSSLMALVLLEMPKEVVEPFIENAVLKYKEKEETMLKRKVEAKERLDASKK